MRTFGELNAEELARYKGGEFFVHHSPRSFKKGIVGEFIPTDEATYRVTTTGFTEPHDTKRFGYWQPTGDKCRYVEIGVELPVFDLSWGTMVVVDEQKGILYEFIPWGTVGSDTGS
jgi:hypothetical protein